ncbi:MAG: radical SAM protein [Deltaproteobacteria bacterium]|nr:radical SAM protein [Deltaproteobacteria bacterium]
MLPEYIKKDINDSFNRITASFEAFWQITIKLCDGCTLACLHCSHHCEKPTLIHVSNVLKIIDKCKLSNLTKSILLTGGEPLIYPEIDKIFKKLHCENIPFDVNTCLFVDIKNVEKLVNYNVRCLRYSIYGQTKEEHNAFTHRDS